MLGYGYSYSYSPFGRYLDASIASVICLFLAIIAAIVLFIVFMPAKNESKYRGFLLWAHRALNFRSMFSLSLLKFLYLLSVCFITIFGLYMLFASFFIGIAILLLGNLVTRVLYESFILIFSIHDNLSQINTNTSFLKGIVNKTEPTANVPATPNTQQSNQQQSNPEPQVDQQSNTYSDGKQNDQQQEPDNNQ
ncbi:MAG: hypothetical protein ACOX1Q_08115 [Eubacteriales bacterium]